MSHTLSMNEGFLSELVALPAKEQAQIGAKLKLLTAEPRPDAKAKLEPHMRSHTDSVLQ